MIDLDLWCLRRDLNSHRPVKVRGILNPLCLPISPPRQGKQILNQIEIRCQFNYKSFLLICVALLAFSCSSNKPKNEEKIPDKKLETQRAYQDLQSPGWLKVPKRFSFKGEYSEYLHHPFFDEIPGKDFDKKILNAILVTPQNSKHLYNLDLASGQILKSFSFCSQEDLLRQYSEKIKGPKFSLGLVPRILDQTASPQKIVVFGKVPEEMKPGMLAIVSVVGGVIELECKTWPCSRAQGWKPRVVLLAKFLDDEEFKEVKNIAGLKELIDWDYFKSFMENGQGVHSGLVVPKVGYQIKNELSAEEALNMVFRDGHVFSSLELFSMRSTCHKIYDYLYDSVSKDSNRQKRMEKFNKNAPESIYKSFKDFLPYFLKNYGDRYFTCNKYVRPSNPFDNPQRHWFFSSFSAFMNLRGLNFFYSCDNKSWGHNPYNFEKMEFVNNFEAEIAKCNSSQINFAFSTAPNKLEMLVRQNIISFKYLTYDSSPGGSHQKIYGWVPFNGLGPYCKDPKEKETYLRDFQTSHFPADVRWNPIN